VTVAEPVLAAVELQRLGVGSSPLYGELLAMIGADASAGGPCAVVLRETPPDVDPVLDALPLRFLGGVHRIVLDGRSPELAAHYPSAGGHFDPTRPGTVRDAFIATVHDHRAELIDSLARGVQTNEVGRCACLLPGFLAVGAMTALPLRVLEIGTSAGLNLRWDRYRYEGGAGDSAWGDPGSALRFTDVYEEPRPAIDGDVAVVDRRGCDRSPVDATSPDGALLLRSFVWADQLERFTALDAAIAIARGTPVTIDRADALEWVEARLAEPSDGVATVVFHSIVWQYLPREKRHAVKAAIESAGRHATRQAPLAWLRMEPGRPAEAGADVRLTTWPDGDERLLVRSGYHGRPVRCVDPRTS
jgi:hypothetical protein